MLSSLLFRSVLFINESRFPAILADAVGPYSVAAMLPLAQIQSKLPEIR